jgi:hypothetical protein
LKIFINLIKDRVGTAGFTTIWFYGIIYSKEWDLRDIIDH